MGLPSWQDYNTVQVDSDDTWQVDPYDTAQVLLGDMGQVDPDDIGQVDHDDMGQVDLDDTINLITRQHPHFGQLVTKMDEFRKYGTFCDINLVLPHDGITLKVSYHQPSAAT